MLRYCSFVTFYSFGLADAMRVLIGCEESTTIRTAFEVKGHDAWSCDLKVAPGKHIQNDILEVMQDDWDLFICHPPCTYLCSSGIHWRTVRPEREFLANEAKKFARKLWEAPIGMIALENPIGRLIEELGQASQIIQPYQFGEDASKATCLWLKELLPLKSTKIIEPNNRCKCEINWPEPKWCNFCGERTVKRWSNQSFKGQSRLGPSEQRSTIRSKTYNGIALAMAEQWSINDWLQSKEIF